MKIAEKLIKIDMEKIFVKFMFTVMGVSTCIVFFYSF